MNLRREFLGYTRAREQLLCIGGPITDDERGLLEYYVKELSREFLADSVTVQVPYNESAGVNRRSAS